MSRFAAIVLAGGASRRMGRPKAWIELGGRSMLQRVVTAVAAPCAPVVVVGAPGQALPAVQEPTLRVEDPVEGRGPLQGLAVGLETLRQRAPEVEAAYLSSCDVPLLKPEFVQAMLDRLGAHDVAVPREERFHHPLAAVYRISTALPAVEALLAADRLRPFFLFEQLNTHFVAVEELRSVDASLQSLQNCNTPEDLDGMSRSSDL